METIKEIAKAILSIILFGFSLGAHALSADGPAYDYNLQKAESGTTAVRTTDTGHKGFLIYPTDQNGNKQIFGIYCRRGDPKLVVRYSAKDVNGEWSNYATDFAIQWYPPGSLKARELFEHQEMDMLIAGRTTINIYDTLDAIAKHGKGMFTFTMFNTGMQGQITTNVVSLTLPPQAAEELIERFASVDDGHTCDEATGKGNTKVNVAQYEQ